jgi:hypothetical protein
MRSIILAVGFLVLAVALACSGSSGSGGTGGGSNGGGSHSGGGSAGGGSHTGGGNGGGSSGGGSSGGGSSGGGSSGGGSNVTCTELTAGPISFDFQNSSAAQMQASYFASPMPDTGDTAVPDQISLQFYGGVPGMFDLAMAPDDNYKTCTNCVLLYQDPTAMGVGKTFYQASGTLFVDQTSDINNGTLHATLTNVKLIEVTIDNTTFQSTPVAGGACVHIATATWDVVTTPPPAGWTCGAAAYNDTKCDCGCGVQDVACANTTDAGACQGCPFCSKDGMGDDCAANVNATDTTKCIPVVAGWRCPNSFYGDGSCDCGCGAADSTDCAVSGADAGVDAGSPAACQFCDFCMPGMASCAAVVYPTNTSLCLDVDGGSK